MTNFGGEHLTRCELTRRVGRLEQVAGVRLVVLGDGIERGVRVLEFRTGSGYEFDVLVDRALDVGRCEYRGRALAWLSAPGVVAPWYAEPMGLGWFRSWGGGMLVTCGLDHTLLGGVDEVPDFHQDVRPTEEYGLMGRIGMMPARLSGYGEHWDGEEWILWAEGVVRQAAVLYLYHVNVGWPVVDAGADYLIPAPAGTPEASYPTIEYRQLTAPKPGFREECYEHAVVAEADETVPVAVVNRKLGLGVYQLYKRDQFPFHTMWRMLGEGSYAVAMEPTTNRDAGRFDARERGELTFLAPGETRRYDLELGVLDGVAAIEGFESRVDNALVGSRGAGARQR
ncbi:MAG: DUF4432 family protein [Solirubrobacteraceae bacterium]